MTNSEQFITTLETIKDPMMTRAFISLPMRDHTIEEIQERQDHIFSLLQTIRKEPYRLTFTLFTDEPEEDVVTNIWYLGRSIQALSESDFAIFANNWISARGCVIERLICFMYGIPTIEECDLINENKSFDILHTT